MKVPVRVSGELRRYTDIMSVIDMLVNKHIVLLSPRAWDDQNDAQFMRVYAERKRIKGALALCLANSAETYHHWRIFSGTNAGACIVFDKAPFGQYIRAIKALRYGKVAYHTNPQFSAMRPIATDTIPFSKRAAFAAEKEYRIVYDYDLFEQSTQDIPIPLSLINRIVLSPWAPRNVCLSVCSALKSIKDCSKIRILRSGLINNEVWQASLDNPDNDFDVDALL